MITLTLETILSVRLVVRLLVKTRGITKLAFTSVVSVRGEEVAKMVFASIYPLYLNRLERNGKSKQELDQIIKWFTGFDASDVQGLIEQGVTFRTFFQRAQINPNAHLIKGVVCGYRIDDIEEKFDVYKQCRRLEKLIDELAKGRKMEKILRNADH